MRSAIFSLPSAPDAACVMVAESIIDAYLERDRNAQVQISVMGSFGALFISGIVSASVDIDVATVARRTLGQLGCGGDIEPFVSIETVPPSIDPMVYAVSGFACNETPEMLPLMAAQARRLAAACETYRQTHEQGFWLGADVEGSLVLRKNAMSQIFLRIEHGSVDVREARAKLVALMGSVLPGAKVRVNDTGPIERRGLQHALGRMDGWEQMQRAVCGPARPAIVGVEPRHPQKAGAWLTRQAARSLVAKGYASAYVQALYEPGHEEPMMVMARDEKGKRLEQEIAPGSLRLSRVMDEFWRPGLNQEAARFSYIGGNAVPWET